MTYDQLLERIIGDGIAEVEKAYVSVEDEPKRLGAIAGFNACRGKNPTELVLLWTEASNEISMARRIDPSGTKFADYERRNYYQLQVEWVCNVVSVAMLQAGQGPLLSWLPTVRGALKYAEIVGTAPPLTASSEKP